jgi:regulator of protease activity HflC (stomatin/prohibitin superfamily)
MDDQPIIVAGEGEAAVSPPTNEHDAAVAEAQAEAAVEVAEAQAGAAVEIAEAEAEAAAEIAEAQAEAQGQILTYIEDQLEDIRAWQEAHELAGHADLRERIATLETSLSSIQEMLTSLSSSPSPQAPSEPAETEPPKSEPSEPEPVPSRGARLYHLV